MARLAYFIDALDEIEGRHGTVKLDERTRRDIEERRAIFQSGCGSKTLNPDRTRPLSGVELTMLTPGRMVVEFDDDEPLFADGFM